MTAPTTLQHDDSAGGACSSVARQAFLQAMFTFDISLPRCLQPPATSATCMQDHIPALPKIAFTYRFVSTSSVLHTRQGVLLQCTSLMSCVNMQRRRRGDDMPH